MRTVSRIVFSFLNTQSLKRELELREMLLRKFLIDQRRKAEHSSATNHAEGDQ
jgi:hypothetical protein